jgi:hypothetical protein
MHSQQRPNITLRQTAKQLGLTVSEPYRVGIGWELHRLLMHLAIGRWKTAPRREWRAARRSAWRLLRRLPIRADWGIWQCEGTLGLPARRGMTARAAERRMLTDEINAALGWRRSI